MVGGNLNLACSRTHRCRGVAAIMMIGRSSSRPQFPRLQVAVLAVQREVGSRGFSSDGSSTRVKRLGCQHWAVVRAKPFADAVLAVLDLRHPAVVSPPTDANEAATVRVPFLIIVKTGEGASFLVLVARALTGHEDDVTLTVIVMKIEAGIVAAGRWGGTYSLRLCECRGPRGHAACGSGSGLLARPSFCGSWTCVQILR